MLAYAIALFDIERSIALYNFFSGKGDRSFCIERSIGLYNFFTLRRAIALFGIVPVDRLFGMGGRSL